jgi:hypothetical protein
MNLRKTNPKVVKNETPTRLPSARPDRRPAPLQAVVPLKALPGVLWPEVRSPFHNRKAA